MSDSPSGAYPTHNFVSCTGCGQLSRIEVAYPLVQASTLSVPKYCPLCGRSWHYVEGYGNGTQFKLVARFLFGREPAGDEVAMVESIYPMWDAYVHPTFKEFLRSLVNSGS